jgi:magnesium chelatase family protein
VAGEAPLAPYRNGSVIELPQYPDLCEVKGQAHAKRALEIAACGSHALLMLGPPGTGKSMLAARLPGILPPMSEAEALDSAAVLSASSSGFDAARWRTRPYRAPHHGASAAALIGGGLSPRPGEISLAHHGVLFLDELPEFPRDALEALREPLESGSVAIARAARHATYPARFQLVAAMNPCPCGHLGDPSGRCRCTPDQVARYRSKVSGPLLDRIDLKIEVPRPRESEMTGAGDAETSAVVRNRVRAARERQLARQAKPNAWLQPRETAQHCAIDSDAESLLKQAIARLSLSARGYHRVLRVARSIADLEGSNGIASAHVAEAIQYRRLDAGL